MTIKEDIIKKEGTIKGKIQIRLLKSLIEKVKTIMEKQKQAKEQNKQEKLRERTIKALIELSQAFTITDNKTEKELTPTEIRLLTNQEIQEILETSINELEKQIR